MRVTSVLICIRFLGAFSKYEYLNVLVDFGKQNPRKALYGGKVDICGITIDEFAVYLDGVVCRYMAHTLITMNFM